MNSVSQPPLEAFFFHDFKNSYIPHILKEISIDKVYEPFLTDKKDLIICDIGANIGLTSYYFKDYAKKVIAVEPSKLHQQALAAMVKQNEIKNIVLFPVAVAAGNGEQKFYHNNNTTMYSLRSEVNDTSDFETVETVTMEELMKRAEVDHIDICKMDVEGSEGDIVTSEAFEKVAPKIKMILGEWHQWCSLNPNLFATTLMDLGYEFKWLNKTEASTFSAIRNQ